MLAKEAVNAARDVHPKFDKQSTPDPPALRHLAQYQQELLAAIAETKIDAVHEKQQINFPLVDFSAGAVLHPVLRVHGATVHFIDTDRKPENVTLVEFPLRLDECRFPAAYIEAGVFKPLGIADDWEEVSHVVVDCFPLGPDELAPNDDLVLPGSPMRACVASLSAFMAVRAEVSVPDPNRARESYLDEVTQRKRAKVGRIREIW